MSFNVKLSKAKNYYDFYELAVECERRANHLNREQDKEVKVKESWSQALTAYSECVSLDPNNPKAWNGIGYVFYKLNDMEKALENLERALKADSKYMKAYINIGLANRTLEKYEEALEAFEKARELSPHYKWTWYHVGLIHYILGNIDYALEYLTKANEMSKDLAINNLFNVVKRAKDNTPPEPIKKILEKIEPLPRGSKKDHCNYCGAKFSTDIDNKEKYCTLRLRQMVWKANQGLPDYALRDYTKQKIYGSHDTFHRDIFGKVWMEKKIGKHTIKGTTRQLVPFLPIENFVPLPGNICSKCSEDFLLKTQKCLNKIKSKQFLSKIVKSVEKSLKCYTKIFKSWIKKRNF
mgnify:CR=1 FL=1